MSKKIVTIDALAKYRNKMKEQMNKKNNNLNIY
jgi:hypothetical protein